ncbi:MAG: rod shape-determining protein MreD [Acidobacteria bacterium]|nr:rod shape-determining protein MreD [Acidobacteriota bacterium]
MAALALITLVEHLLSLYLPTLLYVDLFLLYAVYSGLVGSQVAAAYSGFLAGAIQDVLYGFSIGIHGFSKTALAFAVATSNRYILLDSAGLRFPLVVSASLLNSAMIAGLLYILGQPIPPSFVRISLLQVVCTAAGAVVLFPAVDRLRHRGEKELARPYID